MACGNEPEAGAYDGVTPVPLPFPAPSLDGVLSTVVRWPVPALAMLLPALRTTLPTVETGTTGRMEIPAFFLDSRRGLKLYWDIGKV